MVKNDLLNIYLIFKRKTTRKANIGNQVVIEVKKKENENLPIIIKKYRVTTTTSN
jgi:hypothetical protein